MEPAAYPAECLIQQSDRELGHAISALDARLRRTSAMAPLHPTTTVHCGAGGAIDVVVPATGTCDATPPPRDIETCVVRAHLFPTQDGGRFFNQLTKNR